jgi:hypothetical protein
MKKNNKLNRAGLEEQYSPRTAGQNHLHPNTELGIDLKLFTRKPGRMPLGSYLDGIITHDGEDHFTFVQNAAKKSIAGLLEKKDLEK